MRADHRAVGVPHPGAVRACRPSCPSPRGALWSEPICVQALRGAAEAAEIRRDRRHSLTRRKDIMKRIAVVLLGMHGARAGLGAGVGPGHAPDGARPARRQHVRRRPQHVQEAGRGAQPGPHQGGGLPGRAARLRGRDGRGPSPRLDRRHLRQRAQRRRLRAGAGSLQRRLPVQGHPALREGGDGPEFTKRIDEIIAARTSASSASGSMPPASATSTAGRARSPAPTTSRA